MSASGFYHFSVKAVGRSNGRSIVAAVAYRRGERLVDERTGEVAPYQGRGGVMDKFILTREDAPAWAQTSERLWNELERAVTRANGRLATEFELALPHELTHEQRVLLLKDFLAPIVERHGVAIDIAIHEPGKKATTETFTRMCSLRTLSLARRASAKSPTSAPLRRR
jgi:MobA/MobL family